MGAGRKTQTFYLSETPPPRMAYNNLPWARNLNKSQLGGVIFGTTKETMNECLSKQLFGLPARHFSYIQNIEPGMPLFLFNYSDRRLYGIYEAASSGQMNIDSNAWTNDGSNRTQYPAQVQICVRVQCQPLAENQFKPIIIDNYYAQSRFQFELDLAQTDMLLSKFSSLAVAPRPSTVQNRPLWTVVNKEREESGAPEPPPSKDDTNGTSDTSDDSTCLYGNNEWMEEASLCNNQLEKDDEKDLMYLKLKELALSNEFSVCVEAEKASADDVDTERETHDNGDSSAYIIAQLCGEMEELKTFKQEQTQQMKILEKKLADAERKICRLENRCLTLESKSSTSTGLVGCEKVESPDEFHLNLDESIFIVGGYDGVSWSSALDSFIPSHDVLRSLKPMSSARSCASVARFGGELYVFGGGTGSAWYDTVESYNAVKNQWTPLPSLSEKKGSLGGAALNGKVFAIGGGNGIDCFSDVEMFDPCVGRWISPPSMIEKRFALAAVELNGALYAVGGFDGNDYLKTCERFDPRERYWGKIGSMSTKRGCHSLVVLNEKLYALGGYDGIKMVSTVEIYDPRLGKWMSGEPMNQERGYLAAAVLKDSIYVIGGVQTNESIVDKVECYKEGGGWQETSLKAIGKRSFASAIVVRGD